MRFQETTGNVDVSFPFVKRPSNYINRISWKQKIFLKLKPAQEAHNDK